MRQKTTDFGRVLERRRHFKMPGKSVHGENFNEADVDKHIMDAVI